MPLTDASTSGQREPLLALRGVSKAYRNPAETTKVFEGLDLELRRGEITCLVGPSGCGKSTIISLIAGLMRPDAGQVCFDGHDLDAMSDAWEHADRVSCTHPGWRTLHGWGAVSGSWFALFGGPSPLQFILTNEQVALSGDTAWVTVDENLISLDGGGTVAALNVFVRAGERWRCVAHHGSAVAPQT